MMLAGGPFAKVTALPFAPSPDGTGTMLLLTDGSVMVNGGASSNQWFKLTPDAQGNYVDGTWSSLQSSSLQRLYFGSVVLQDGRVLVVGGEYTGPSTANTESTAGEIYNPTTNQWSPITPIPTPNGQFGDGSLKLLSDGTVLAGWLGGSQTFRYNPANDPLLPGTTPVPGSTPWVTDASLLNGDTSSEESWVKLPDGSILTYEIQGSAPQTGQRFVEGGIVAADKWVAAGKVPDTLATNGGDMTLVPENGPAILLPNGKVLYIGATGHTALYTPPTIVTPQGIWVAGPDMLDSNMMLTGAFDAPAAMEADGHVLIATSPPAIGFPGPTTFEEYDSVSNTMSIVTTTGPALAQPGFTGRMLDLPNGQVMISDSSDQLFVYSPVGTPQDSWRPVITSISPAGNGIFTLRGTQLTGLGEGAAYGDDAQMATNYPIVEFTDLAGKVTFARTTNWSTTGVATGAAPESVQFTLPAGKAPSDFLTVKVIANGIASQPAVVAGILVGPDSGNVTIEVDPANAASVRIISNATGLLIGLRPNNPTQLIDVATIPNSGNNTVVTIDERNGIVNVPVTVEGGGLPGDQVIVVGKSAADNLVVTPTSATSANVTYGGSPNYFFQNVNRFTFHGVGNAATLRDTLGGATMTVNGFTQQYDGGTPLTLNNTKSLKVNDASPLGNDTINVIATSVPTTIGNSGGAGGDVINVGSDAPVNQFGLLTTIAAPLTVATTSGKNILVVSDGGSMTANLAIGLTNSKISNPDLVTPISYSAGTGTLNVVLDGSGAVPTTFNVSSTLPAGNTVTLNGGGVVGQNVFNLDSSSGANNGQLNRLTAAITVNGGDDGAQDTTNLLEVNDHGTTGAYNYNLTGPGQDVNGNQLPASVTYDRATSPLPATFGGVSYFGVQNLQLDATEQPNVFTVTPAAQLPAGSTLTLPSFTTVLTIHGYGHGTGVNALALARNGITVTNVPTSPNGFISYIDANLQSNLIVYTNIDTFPAPPINFAIIAAGADAGASSQPLVKVFNAQTGEQLLPTANLLDPLHPEKGFLAYEKTYTGGVSVTVGYFDGSGQPEIAVAPGKNHSPLVKIYDAYGNLKYSFQAYAANFTSGISLAAGNVESLPNGATEMDIVTAPERGVSDIRLFQNLFAANVPGALTAFSNTPFREFTAWSTSFLGGSTVAVANFKPNVPGLPLTWADIIVASGSGMPGTINVYDVTVKRTSYLPFESFMPFGAGFRGGINVSAINPQPNSNITAPTIIASQGTSGTSQVAVLNGLTGAVQSRSTAFTGLGSNAAVHATARVINGRLYVFAAQGTGGRSAKIVRIDALAPDVVDFLLGTDPSNLG